ncbi:hypothetical protein BH18ACI4_BH18ACI4_14040 [soil metagenome]
MGIPIRWRCHRLLNSSRVGDDHPWLLAIFGELDTSEGVKANVRAIKQILDQADAGITLLRLPKRTAQPNGGTARQSQPVRAPQTIPTGLLRNDGRLDYNTASSACTSKALGCACSDTRYPVTLSEWDQTCDFAILCQR